VMKRSLDREGALRDGEDEQRDTAARSAETLLTGAANVKPASSNPANSHAAHPVGEFLPDTRSAAREKARRPARSAWRGSEGK